MYVVIFKATLNQPDDEYAGMLSKLHDLALNEYGCHKIDSVCEGNTEITVSYWPSLEAIKAWKAGPLHQQAQQLSLQGWYDGYQVQVVELLKDYSRSK